MKNTFAISLLALALLAAKAVCPEGWHCPTDGEWKALETSLGMSQEDAYSVRCVKN